MWFESPVVRRVVWSSQHRHGRTHCLLGLGAASGRWCLDGRKTDSFCFKKICRELGLELDLGCWLCTFLPWLSTDSTRPCNDAVVWWCYLVHVHRTPSMEAPEWSVSTWWWWIWLAPKTSFGFLSAREIVLGGTSRARGKTPVSSEKQQAFPPSVIVLVGSQIAARGNATKEKSLVKVVPFWWVSFCGLKGVQEHVAQRQQGWHLMFTGWPSFVLWHLTTCSCSAFSIIRRARTTTVHGSTIASDSTTGSSSSSCCPMCTLDLAVVCRS